ncbi:hypothetical protein WMF27_42310 [Sorangium sp. So ce281]|uniref:hypothetical protein n=1 Tax=Sorangium sp. So ce281 TaxID=3133293 RepID=UPI003F609CC0
MKRLFNERTLIAASAATAAPLEGTGFDPGSIPDGLEQREHGIGLPRRPVPRRGLPDGSHLRLR